jgi:hypothetical protein
MSDDGADARRVKEQRDGQAEDAASATVEVGPRSDIPQDRRGRTEATTEQEIEVGADAQLVSLVEPLRHSDIANCRSVLRRVQRDLGKHFGSGHHCTCTERSVADGIELVLKILDARRVAPVEPPNEFNINEYVWVKVTEAGFRVLADADAKLNAQFPKAPTFDRAGHVRSEQEQHDGWSKWQLWSLMAAFGPSIYLVCDQPFETTIRFGEAQRIAAPPEGTLEKKD